MKRTQNTAFIGAFAIPACLLLSGGLFSQTVGGGFDTLYQWHGSTAADHFGHALATAGDVNNDGFADVIVGMEGEPGSLNTAGSAFVYSGLDGSLLYQFDGAAANDRFGSAVAGGGDINQDGFADVIVGAPGAFPASVSDAGAVYVYSGANGVLLFQLDGLAMADSFGGSVSGAGDVNGDGFDDILVGATGADPGGLWSAGSAYVYSGSTGTLLYQFDGGATYNYFGESVSSAGDLNADGFADVIVGSWAANPNGTGLAGSAYAYSGATGALLYRWNGVEGGDFFGHEVADAGDVNGDGYDDVVVGTFGTNPNGLLNAGSAFVYSGATGALLYQWDGSNDWDNFGSAVAGAGDINADGFADVIVGGVGVNSPSFGDAGVVVIFSGADGSILHRIYGESISAALGGAVSSASDINHDGNIDVIVGAANERVGGIALVGTASVYGFHPYLHSSSSTLSASAGGVLQLDLDFPNAAASHDFKVLLSGSGTGPSSYGVDIPLTLDGLVVDSFLGNYPFATYTNLHGTLSATGDASASITIPAGLQPGLIGRTFWTAAIANPSGQLPEFSSVAVALTITP